MSFETLFNAPSDSRLERLIFTARGWRQTKGLSAHTARVSEDAPITTGQETPVESTQRDVQELFPPVDAINYGRLFLTRRMNDPNREQFVSREYTDVQWAREAEIVKKINSLLSTSSDCK